MKDQYRFKTRLINRITRFSFGERLFRHYVDLKNVFRRLRYGSDIPSAQEYTSEDRLSLAEHYYEVYRKYGNKPIFEATCYEFGAGYELFIAMCMSMFGFKRIIALDRQVNLSSRSIAYAAKRLQEQRQYPKFLPEFNSRNYRKQLSEYYRIDYLAPVDAASVPEPSASVDFVYANSVLEHVPAGDIDGILVECRRLLAPDGVLAFSIDYRDHCWESDGVSPYHFLRYSEKDWNKIRPPDNHNRLRHRDFKHFFEKNGFEILEDQLTSPLDQDFFSPFHEREDLLDALRDLVLAPEFSEYTLEEIAPLYGFWVLKKL